MQFNVVSQQKIHKKVSDLTPGKLKFTDQQVEMVLDLMLHLVLQVLKSLHIMILYLLKSQFVVLLLKWLGEKCFVLWWNLELEVLKLIFLSCFDY